MGTLMGTICIILSIGALFLSYHVFDRRLKLKKNETVFLSINIFIFTSRILFSIPDAISSDCTVLVFLLIVTICASIMVARAYLLNKSILNGYLMGIVLAFPFELLYLMITIG